jgi:hypothetical protein
MKILGIAALLAMASIGCKKNVSEIQNTAPDNASLQRIQTWYEKASISTPSNLTAQHAGLPKGIPNWASVKFNPEDRTFIVPVTISAHGNDAKSTALKFLVAHQDATGKVTDGKFVIVLLKNADGNISERDITAAVLSLKTIPNNLTGAILEYDLANTLLASHHFEKGQLQADKTDMAAGKVKTSTASSFIPENGCEGGTTCIDWYWQTYVNGQLYDEEYLYTDCYCTTTGGNGGGSGQTAQEICQAKFDDIVANSGPVAIKLGSTPIYESPATRSRAYKWKIFACSSPMGGTIYLQSTETGVQYLGSDTHWHWQSLTHGTISTVGGGIYEVTGTTNSAVTTIGTGMLDGWASIVLDFNAKISFGCGPLTYTTSDDHQSPMAWHVNYGWETVPIEE